jgi:hypothetical protein
MNDEAEAFNLDLQHGKDDNSVDFHDVRKPTRQYSIHGQIEVGSCLTPDGILETSDHLVSSEM